MARGLIVYHRDAVLIPVSEIRVIEESVMRRGWAVPSFQLEDQTLSCNRRCFIFSFSLQVTAFHTTSKKYTRLFLPTCGRGQERGGKVS